MHFPRSVPKRRYADYRRYRPLLRQDFLFRCAYCLRHEFFVGGEAGCSIDHHRPIAGPFARPDLAAAYENLYWCCRECNENKGVTWPTEHEHASGWRFLDPCDVADDHDIHLHIDLQGNVNPITNTGQYTSDCLKLWRDQLAHYRAAIIRCTNEATRIRELLRTGDIPDAYREALESLLREISIWLEPPVFNRSR